MIKLSDYLDYLNNEIIQARKKADENAVLVAKEYAKHPYLKYFRVPRYSIPSIKMDIPLKITDISTDKKFNFKLEPKKLAQEINEKINLVNTEKNLNIPNVTETHLQNPEFKSLFKTLESRDQRFVKNIDTVVNTLDFSMPIKTLAGSVFRPQNDTTLLESEELQKILSVSITKNMQVVTTRINDIFIDPDTSSSDDKDKLFVNLHVEMEEDGIRIVQMKNPDGSVVEEITFE